MCVPSSIMRRGLRLYYQMKILNYITIAIINWYAKSRHPPTRSSYRSQRTPTTTRTRDSYSAAPSITFYIQIFLLFNLMVHLNRRHKHNRMLKSAMQNSCFSTSSAATSTSSQITGHVRSNATLWFSLTGATRTTTHVNTMQNS